MSKVVSSLKQMKEQGLTFYDARQSLMKAGFSDHDIQDASWVYNGASDKKIKGPVKKETLKALMQQAELDHVVNSNEYSKELGPNSSPTGGDISGRDYRLIKMSSEKSTKSLIISIIFIVVLMAIIIFSDKNF